MPTESAQLDRVFRALSNPTRRAVLSRLASGAANVSALAEPFDMALPSFLQHLRVLEGSGLVRSRKAGRVRTYQVVPNQLEAASDWMQQQRQLWEMRLDRLERYLQELQARAEHHDGHENEHERQPALRRKRS